MAFFNLKKKGLDRVWSTLDQKMEDILRNVASSKSRDLLPICVYHFSDTGKYITNLFANRKVNFHKLRSLTELDSESIEAWLKKTDVIIFNSNLISKVNLSGKRGHYSKIRSKFELHLIEHYPIPTRDDLLFSYLSHRSDILGPIAYVALTEPWLARVMGGNVRDLLAKMGLDETEVIEHRLLSNSLRKAQVEIAKKIRRDFPYDSVEAWLEGNVLN
ncbi:MAG: hypothetical protein HQ507_11705 [Candidatus Marinimicrobia bacterium]|nr:hypothetical protein [Candidatus Neomarinimicrobiota bacterium]